MRITYQVDGNSQYPTNYFQYGCLAFRIKLELFYFTDETCTGFSNSRQVAQCKSLLVCTFIAVASLCQVQYFQTSVFGGLVLVYLFAENYLSQSQLFAKSAKLRQFNSAFFPTRMPRSDLKLC